MGGVIDPDIVSCHTCHAQVRIIKTTLVMVDRRRRLLPANKERLMRQRGERPFGWARICKDCARKEGAL